MTYYPFESYQEQPLQKQQQQQQQPSSKQEKKEKPEEKKKLKVRSVQLIEFTCIYVLKLICFLKMQI